MRWGLRGIAEQCKLTRTSDFAQLGNPMPDKVAGRVSLENDSSSKHPSNMKHAYTPSRSVCRD